MDPMHIYDSPNFRLNKTQMCLIGLWPYDSRKKIVALFWMLSLCALSIPHCLACFRNLTSDLDTFMENLVTLLIIIATIVKYVTLWIAEKKMKIVYNETANNWLRITDEEEKKILDEHSKRGRMETVTYTSLLGGAGILFVLLPLVPEILNVIYPLSVPRQHMYMMKGEFLVNREDHFYKIYLWDCVTIINLMATCISIDAMYNVIIEQVTALYAIVTYRLSKLRYRLADNVTTNDNSYEWMMKTIQLHQVVLSFTDNVNDSYSLCFLCLMIINMVALPTGCIVVLINLEHPMDCFRYVSILVSLFLHVFILFYPGQKIIDYSERLLNDAYSNEWYETPPETKKLLRIFQLRCSEPSIITAGGLTVMNFENFAKVIKTAVSYVTVVASFRNKNE